METAARINGQFFLWGKKLHVYDCGQICVETLKMMQRFLPLLLVLLPKSSIASSNGLSDELRFIHQEMRSLRDENLKQNLEIASLKETVQLQNTSINQHEKTIKDLITDNHKMIKNDRSVALSRRERPAQLIPPSILKGERKNSNDKENRKQFYGPPTSCSELAQLGYTLNGFYLVKNPVVDSNFPLATKTETVYCAFKQEGTYNPFLVQHSVMPSSFPSNPFSSSFSLPSSKPDEDISFYVLGTRKTNNPFYGILTFQNADVNLNIGNPFNPNTGYFNTLKNGIYHFSYEMTSFDIKGNENRVNFYMNDIIVTNTFALFSEVLGSSKIIHQVTLKLKIGDTICLKAAIKENRKYVPTKTEIFQESFMGYLLKTTHL